MKIDIREIALQDAAAAARLSVQLGYACTEAEMAERITRIGQSPTDVAWVAALGDSPLGWIQVTRTLRLQSGQAAEITGLVVDSRARGAGVGRQLVAQAQAWARMQGLSRLHVRMNVMRSESMGFYLQLGFKEKKRQVVFEIQY